MRIGIDLGGTKIEAIAIDGDGSIVAPARRVATPKNYQDTLSAIRGLVEGIESELDTRCRVGIGIPGAVSTRNGTIKNANSVWLNGRELPVELAQALDREVRIANDANCFALSEASDGAGAGAATVFGVILGTGVGGGIVVDGRPLEGLNRIAGEWGHTPLPWPRDDERPGRQCYCGKYGCVETWISGPGFERDYPARAKDAFPSREIVARAIDGEAIAAQTLNDYVDRLARSLAIVINIVDPDVVVLGGGMSNVPDLAPRATEALPNYVFSDEVLTRVVRNVHGDSSGVRGAAWLWPA
ncbi:MAG: ROK family protein [Wenzhouxiangella sp.]|jgi:fructokinase|nr:ROK family protein [Wenzhouxiangella sp.]